MPQAGLTPERLQAQRQLCAACAVCCVFMAGEVVGKLESSSSNPILSTPASAALRPPTESIPAIFLGGQAEKGMAGVGSWVPRKWERVTDSTKVIQGSAPRQRAGLASQH